MMQGSEKLAKKVAARVWAGPDFIIGYTNIQLRGLCSFSSQWAENWVQGGFGVCELESAKKLKKKFLEIFKNPFLRFFD